MQPSKTAVDSSSPAAGGAPPHWLLAPLLLRGCVDTRKVVKAPGLNKSAGHSQQEGRLQASVVAAAA